MDDDAQVKGYRAGTDSYVMREDEEIEAVALESTRTIDIEMFVAKGKLIGLDLVRQTALPHPGRSGRAGGIFGSSADAMAATRDGRYLPARLIIAARALVEPRDNRHCVMDTALRRRSPRPGA